MKSEEIHKYIYDEIVPKYASFDDAHKEDHALTVINESMKLLDGMNEWVNSQMDLDDTWKVSVDRSILKMILITASIKKIPTPMATVQIMTALGIAGT